MKNILFIILYFSFLGCAKPKKLINNIEIVTRSIVGLVPSDDFQVEVISADSAKFVYYGSTTEIFNWIYSWPVTKDKYDHLELNDFLQDAQKYYNAKKFFIVNDHSFNYSFEGENHIYSLECSVEPYSSGEARCTIVCTKLN